MKKYLTCFLLVFSFLWLSAHVKAQDLVRDQSIVYQQERMVFQQWDQNKFTPTHGFLWLNPYYWLVWGFFYPNYHKTDLRPLSATGPQTQRLALVGAMNGTEQNYKWNADTIRNTAISQIANTTGLISDADPLWLLYYNQQFQPLMNYSAATLLGSLPAAIAAKLIAEGTYAWYTNELDMLKERVQGAHSADMDRGARILAYYRLLKEYRTLAGVWAIRTAAAQKTMTMAAQQQQLHNGQAAITTWTPNTDVKIAAQVLAHANY